MPKGVGYGKVNVTAPDQAEAISQFDSVGEFKNLNKGPRGEFAAQGTKGKNPDCTGAVYGSPGQDEALGAIAGGISGGGKLSSEDEAGFADDILSVGKDSNYGWNADSPFRG